MTCAHERLLLFRRYTGVDVHPIVGQRAPFHSDDEEADFFEPEEDLDLGKIESDEYEEVHHHWVRCAYCNALIWEA